MFLSKLMEKNQKLVDSSIELYRKGQIEPDSYVVDVDTLLENASKIKNEADKNSIRLFFMLKQLGRNPYIARKLVEIGYEGAVAVDFREAEIYIKNEIPISNIGHLVQVPKSLMTKIIKYGVDVATVYSFEKLVEINNISKTLNKVQKIMLKISGNEDLFYGGQLSGIELNDLEEFIKKSRELNNIKIVGITAFPCYLYDEDKKDITETNNYFTLKKALKIFESNNIKIEYIDTPSTTSILTLKKMKDGIGNIGEPGHGFTGTTPAHAELDLPEIPCVEYITEISHNFRGKSYAYGGGYYRRSHLENCLVTNDDGSHLAKVNHMDDSSIDYYFEIDNEEKINSIVTMAFRYQIFVTRSKVVLIKGLKDNNPEVIGVYNSLGGKVYE